MKPTPEQVRFMRETGDAIAATVVEFANGLGIDVCDEAVARLARRSVLLARARQGFDEGDPDRDGGPPLSVAEQAGILRLALRRAEARALPPGRWQAR